MSLPKHEGDLNDMKPSADETDLPAKTAKSAKTVLESKVGSLGTLADSAPLKDAQPDVTERIQKTGVGGAPLWPEGSNGAAAKRAGAES